MIQVYFYKNHSKRLTGFKVCNHGLDIVCAAVSILTQNMVNSIETFTDADFTCDYEPDGGFMAFRLREEPLAEPDAKADLLLESLFLGITGIKEQYGDYLDIYIEEV